MNDRLRHHADHREHPRDRGKLLLAASTGGHLAQLVRLAPGLGATDDSLWVTFRTPQSESLLKGRNVLYVPYIRPRDAANVVRAYQSIRAVVKSAKFRRCCQHRLGARPGRAAGREDGRTAHALHRERLARRRAVAVRTHPRPAAPGGAAHAAPALVAGRWGVHPSVLSTFHNVHQAEPGRRPAEAVRHPRHHRGLRLRLARRPHRRARHRRGRHDLAARLHRGRGGTCPAPPMPR